MQNLLNNIIKTRCGGAVERCHTIPHIGSYSNGKHSWGVAMLMLQLFPKDFPRLAAHCLTHDVAEAWTGDIPAPVLWAIGSIKMAMNILENDLLEDAGCPRLDELSAEDHKKLKACDSLELFFWCIDQINFGNQNVWDCYRALSEHFIDNPMPLPAQDLFLSIMKTDQLVQLLPEQQGIIKKIRDKYERP